MSPGAADIPIELIKESAELLRGPCQSVELYPQVALRFRYGVLFVSAAWRASQGMKMVAGEGKSKDSLPGMVIGASVKAFDVKGPYHDLVVVFDNGVVLETFGDSAEYEHWNVSSLVDRRQLIVGPERLWSSF